MIKTLKILLFIFSALVISTPLLADSPPELAAGDDLGLLDGFGFGGQEEILPVDEAFVLDTEVTSNGFIARWVIAEGTYLYRDKIEISVDDPEIQTGALQKPAGDLKEDKVLGETLYVYHNATEVILPLSHNLTGDKVVNFKVTYLGCNENVGICYPPQNKVITATLSPSSGAAMPLANPDTTSMSQAGEKVSEQDQLVNALRGDENLATLLLFYVGGLLLAFTPCVLPMVPILSGIIVGQGKETTTRQAFVLSLVYVLAMAATYTVVGVLVGLSGENIQALFQDPWIIGFFATIIVALSFSMFGFYDLQMPASIQSKLASISNSQQGGTLTGVAIMGFLSALIVGPCVTAPLVGALIYIAETGDALLGGMALFSLSLGMGTPLLLIGTSAGKLLPKAGPWMDAVKAVFGVLLLGLAIWLLERVIPAEVGMALWASLLIVSAIYMGAIDALPAACSGWRKLWKGLGILILVYGVIMIIGLAAGNSNMLAPLRGMTFSGQAMHSNMPNASHLEFKQIKGVEGLNAALAEARANNQTVMLDFYADWCISCKEMEVLTFSDAAVQEALKDTMLLQADVTPNDEQDKALYKHFGIIGPPSIMFFDPQGNELKNYRVVGFMKADAFSQHIRQAFN